MTPGRSLSYVGLCYLLHNIKWLAASTHLPHCTYHAMLCSLLHFPTFSLSLGQNILKGSSHALFILLSPVRGRVTGTIWMLRNVLEIERRPIFLLLRFLEMDPSSPRMQSSPQHVFSPSTTRCSGSQGWKSILPLPACVYLEWPSFQRSEIFSI